jgi:hypothetical protein
MAGILADIAWAGFKLTFGLTSLASVWATAVLKNGALWASDTQEEKRELAAGTSMSEWFIWSLLTPHSTEEALESRPRAAPWLPTCFLQDQTRHESSLRYQCGGRGIVTEECDRLHPRYSHHNFLRCIWLTK